MNLNWLIGDPLVDCILLFVLGSMMGSFGNVCIYRIPKNQSIVFPSSRCQKCNYAIPWYLNIPIFAWIALRGKCANCKAPFSIRYPIVEAVVGIAFVLLYLRYGWSWTLLEYCIFAWGLIVSSVIDLDHMILPDSFTLSGIVLGVVGAFINPERSAMDAIVGVLVGGGFLLSISYLYYLYRKVEGLGGGDIKLLAWIGAYLGWQSIPFTLFFSSFVGLFVGVIYLWLSKKDMQTGIPFGPFLSAGAMVYALVDVEPLIMMIFPMAGSGF